jgi:hypothetical protein
LLWSPADRQRESLSVEGGRYRLEQPAALGEEPLEDLTVVVATELAEALFPEAVLLDEPLPHEDHVMIADPAVLADDLVDRPDESTEAAQVQADRLPAAGSLPMAFDETREDPRLPCIEDDDESREAVAARLFYLEHRSVGEIARLLDCPNAIVRAMLQEADIHLALADAGL